MPYGHRCDCCSKKPHAARARTETAIDAASEATKCWYLLSPAFILFPGAEARGEYWPRGKRRCVGRRSSHPDGPVAAGIPLIETASKNVPSLAETVPRCDSDTRAGGVDGCVQLLQAASKQQRAQSSMPCRLTCCRCGHASMALFADRHGKSLMLRAGRYYYYALHVML